MRWPRIGGEGDRHIPFDDNITCRRRDDCRQAGNQTNGACPNLKALENDERAKLHQARCHGEGQAGHTAFPLGAQFAARWPATAHRGDSRKGNAERNSLVPQELDEHVLVPLEPARVRNEVAAGDDQDQPDRARTRYGSSSPRRPATRFSTVISIIRRRVRFEALPRCGVMIRFFNCSSL